MLYDGMNPNHLPTRELPVFLYIYVCIYLLRLEWLGQRACLCSGVCVCVQLCDPMDCSLPGSSAHGIFQASVGTMAAQWWKICLPMKEMQETWIPESGTSPGESTRQPTPVFLPGESQGQRSLVSCSPRGCKESDTNELTHMHLYYLLSNRFSQWLYWCTLLQDVCEISSCSISCPTLGIVALFYFSHSGGCGVVSVMVWICSSLMTNEVMRACLTIHHCATNYPQIWKLK